MNYPEAVWWCMPILSGSATTPVGWVWFKWEIDEGRFLFRYIFGDPNKPPIDVVVEENNV